MAFLVLERVMQDSRPVLRPTGEQFSLAGRNTNGGAGALIYRAWEQQGRPTETGWHVDADGLIRLRLGDQYSRETRRLAIDFDPGSRRRIAVIELLDVYAYTFAGTEAYGGEVSWTPLMLRLKDLLYQEYEREISPDEKRERLACIPAADNADAPDIIEFLYLNGTDRGWSWGKNGMTNAAFIQGAARAYFRRFF